MRIFRFDEIGSTSDFLKEKKDIKPYDIAIAKKQTKGRGQWEREWFSGEGGAWFTLVVPMDKKKDIEEYEGFTLDIAKIVISVLKNKVDLKYRIKPPNDIYIYDKKLAGILVEKVESYFYVGIGVNVNIKKVGRFDDIATSLYKETGREFVIDEIIFEIAKKVKEYK